MITSDGGLLAYRELDDVLALTTIGGERLADAGTGKNSRHLLVGLLRQSVFGRLAGYEDVNDAERLRRDPAMRWVVGDRAITGSAASASQMGPLHESALSVRHLGRSMNGLRADPKRPLGPAYENETIGPQSSQIAGLKTPNGPHPGGGKTKKMLEAIAYTWPAGPIAGGESPPPNQLRRPTSVIVPTSKV